jgi:hypothetical protein
MPEACGLKAYRNGKTFDQCRQEARKRSVELGCEVEKFGQIPWSRVMEASGHDELVYKLALKYLRESGFDIGNGATPRVRSNQMRK